MNIVIVKPIVFESKQYIDVFVDKGWNHWSRFEVAFVKGRLMLKLVKGKPMLKEQFKQLYDDLSR